MNQRDTHNAGVKYYSKIRASGLGWISRVLAELLAI